MRVEHADPNDVNRGTDNNTATADVLVLGADLEMEKVASPGPYLEGDTITFTLTVTNNGPEDAESVRVVDRLRPGRRVPVGRRRRGIRPGVRSLDGRDLATAPSAVLNIDVTTRPGHAGTDIAQRGLGVARRPADQDRRTTVTPSSSASRASTLKVTKRGRPSPAVAGEALFYECDRRQRRPRHGDVGRS